MYYILCFIFYILRKLKKKKSFCDANLQQFLIATFFSQLKCFKTLVA